MNILIVASKFPPEYSGPGVRIPRLYKAIAADLGIARIDVLCGGIEYHDNADYEHEGFHVRRRAASFLRKQNFLPARLTNFLAYNVETIIGLRALKHYKNIDLVHIIGHCGHTAAALHWARRRNIPVLMELVNAQARPCQKFFVFGKVCPPENSVIVVLNDELEKVCRDAGFSKQVWKRPNPVDETVFSPDPERKMDFRRKISPFNTEDIVITSVAKMIPRKNQIFLVDVLRHLPERYKLILAGSAVKEGPLAARDRAYIENIKARVAEYGLQNRVHLAAGYVDSSLYMKASDIYALPAWDEGLGTPMIEALSCGVPVVANADEAAFREYIRDGQNGFLCSLENPQYWASSIEKAASFPLEQRLKEASLMQTLASQSKIYDEYKRHLGVLLAKRKETL